MALNWIVALFKIAFGWTTQCMVIMADGLHSFSDGANNVVGLVAVRIAGNPADEDHPYGHQKFETFASILIAFFLFVVAFEIAREGVMGFFEPKNPRVSAASFVLMSVTLIVNCFVVWYERAQGKKLKSDFLISDSWHTLTDILVTLSVFLALAGIQAGFGRLDSFFAIAIGVVIAITALHILKKGLDVLVDKAVLDPMMIKTLALSVQDVKDCHEIRTRGNMDNIYVDLHVLVDEQMTVARSHALANLVESKIRKELTGIRDVMVHIEPLSHDHKEIETESV